MRRLLLTDCDRAFLDELSQRLSRCYDVRACNYGPDVLEEYLTFQPELLVLDTAMPGCDTAGLLRTVRSRDTETLVIATACGFNPSMLDVLENTSCLLIKPCDCSAVATRLEELEQLLLQHGASKPCGQISAILQELGLERNQVGFSCLTESILYLKSKPGCLFTDDLYPHTANICGGSAQSVDKAMKRSIRKAWCRRSFPIWDHYLGKSSLCPTNTCFIRAIAKAIK